MKHSDLLRYCILTENSDYGRLTSSEIRALLGKAESNTVFEDFYQEMEMDSPFAEFWKGKGCLSGMESLHSHSFYEILYCTFGKVQYLLGTIRCLVGVGDLLVIPPGISHRRFFHEEMPYERYGVWINASQVSTFEQQFPGFIFPKEEPRILHTQGTSWEVLETYFSQGWEMMKKRELLWEIEVYGQAVSLLAKLCQALQNPSGRITAKSEPDLLDAILEYIEANLADRITLSDTAHRFFVSESHITHLFRKKAGISFYRYVTQRRLIAAKTWIEKGMALEQVGESVGFASYSNFYRAFLKEYGIAPSKYREMCVK